jgi:peroxiredoxin
LRNRLKDFDARGAQVLVVDPHESSRVRHLLKEAGFEPQDVHVPMLADPANAVSATYGVAFQMQIHTEWSNRPASFVIDRDGMICFAHRAKSYGDRPTPEALLKELAKLKGN